MDNRLLPPLQQSLPPTTTMQEDATTAGQRKVNLIWETTQATIAVTVTLALIFTSVMHIIAPELNNAFFLIVGFYFSRSNHTAIGGIGPKPTDTQNYIGR